MRTALIFLYSFFLANTVVIAQSDQQLQSRGVKKYTSEVRELEKGKWVSTKTISLFDKRGRLVEEWKWENDSLFVSHNKWTYWKKNKPATRESYNSKNELTRNWVYKYDALGNEIGLMEYRMGRLHESTETTYDADGKRTEVKRFDKDGVLQSTIRFVYDNKGLLVLRESLDAQGNIVAVKTNSFEY